MGWCVQGVGGTRAGFRDELWLSFLCPNVQGSGFDPEPARGLEGARWGALGFIWQQWGVWGVLGKPGAFLSMTTFWGFWALFILGYTGQREGSGMCRKGAWAWEGSQWTRSHAERSPQGLCWGGQTGTAGQPSTPAPWESPHPGGPFLKSG